MLKITRSTTVDGTSVMEDDSIVATFYGNITGDGTNMSMNVINQELYDANKKQVRADKREFDDFVYDLEDKAGDA
ncbi:hypothetical protein ACRHK7_01080 [Weissella tructae]|uniref:hypothetical protein n=1 Tax=Weissella tructae TaxID=887702 RepID=UPI003D94D365